MASRADAERMTIDAPLAALSPRARSFLIEALRFDQKRESCSQIYDVEQDSRFSRRVAIEAT
jgi:hypothetical protein